MRTIIDRNENPKTKLLSRAVLLGATAILIYLALVKLIIHLLTANNYGYFVDEFYWLAMAKHLDFGYVDVTPLVAYVGAAWRFLFGASMFSIRFLPALAGAIMVFFAGLLAREMGGGRFAQGFTALMVLTAPIWLMFNSLFAYDPFDQLCSIILFYLIVRLIKKETPSRTSARQWIGIGIMAGLGILTKVTMVFTVGALVLALLASPGRKSFLTKWPWLAAGIAILLCTPYTIWQWVHGWPLITYSLGYIVNRFSLFSFLVGGTSSGLLQFFCGLLLNPVLLPVLLLGLCYLLFHPEGKKYRPLGLSFLVLLIFYICLKLGPLAPKFLMSASFPLLAAGVVWLEKIIIGAAPSSREHGKGAFRLTPWLVRVYLGVILIFTLTLAPLALPLLPIDALKKYEAVTPRFITETLTMGNELPAQFAFRFGWPELVQKVAEVYHRLPEAEQKKCVILTEFYGHAGAIDLLGKKYGLPNAISTHLSYYFWGTDPERTGIDPKVVIFLGFSGRIPRMAFDEVSEADYLIGNPLGSRLSKSLPIFVCRKPKRPLKEMWPSLVNFY